MFFKERKAVKDLTARAGRGEAEAEFGLAERYWNGKGVKADIKQSLELFGDAAKHGSVDAQLRLGELYYNGVADVYGDGNGIDRDYKKAAYWFEKAVENGAEISDELCMELGEIYRWGEYGVEADPSKSLLWYLKVAEKGDEDAMGKLAGCYFILEDKENALFWQNKAAAGGDVDAMCSLGAMYHDFGDIGNALIWYAKAAEKDDSFALCSLGEIYLNGDGVEKNPAKAEEYLRKSAALGYEEAQKLLEDNFKR